MPQVTLEEVTKPRHGSVHPWPLNSVLNWQKRSGVVKRLSALGWTTKTVEDSASKSSIRRFVITEKAPTRTQFHVERPWGQRPFSIVS